MNDALTQLLGSNSTNRLGFSMKLNDAGDFDMGWNSLQVNDPNPNFTGRTVPEAMRPQILDVIKATTGRTAR